MKTLDIVNRFYALADYDPDSRSIRLDETYILVDACKKMDKLFKNFEDDGSIAAIYAKDAFLTFVDRAKVTMLEILTKRDAFQEYEDMYSTFMGPEMRSAEDSLLEAMHRLAQNISGKELLGERDREAELKDVTNAVASVVDEIGKLRVECYKRGGPLSKNIAASVSPQIFVFPTLAQCVLALEQAQDGMRLCYIRNGNTADGYFGIFVKDNGNLLSFNERADEAFVGQHKGARYARWTDEKTYRIFPYGIFEFSKHDAKGYSTVHTIDESKLSFADMPEKDYFSTILAILLLTIRYGGKANVGEEVFIDSLLPTNLKCLKEKTEALIPIEPAKSAIVASTHALDIGLSTSDVLTANKSGQFNYDPNDPKKAHGIFPEQTPGSYAQMLIDLYGEGFELDTAAILRSDSSLRMLPAGPDAAEEHNVEFVGSKDRLQVEAYRQSRKQLADYIRQKMFEEYKAFGGCKAVAKWWQETMRKRYDAIEEMCVELYQKREETDATRAWELVQKENDISAYCAPDTGGKTPETGWGSMARPGSFIFQEMEVKTGRSGYKHMTGNALCPKNNTRASVYFCLRPLTWKGLEKLADCEVPKILKGWQEQNDRGAGNHLLDATDAVWSVETPVETAAMSWNYNKTNNLLKQYQDADLGSGVNFSIAIAWSKRAWAEILKKHGVQS